MQKFGVLYLNKGSWNGHQLVPRAWVERSFEPWIKSHPTAPEPDYGWFWWTVQYRAGWKGHQAQGWKGQRIVVFPEHGVVVSMTGYMNDDEERLMKTRLIEDYVVPSVDHGKTGPLTARPEVSAELARVLEEVRRGPSRTPPNGEQRMLPSVTPKGKHRDKVSLTP
jgi:hypothetical protein